MAAEKAGGSGDQCGHQACAPSSRSKSVAGSLSNVTRSDDVAARDACATESQAPRSQRELKMHDRFDQRPSSKRLRAAGDSAIRVPAPHRQAKIKEPSRSSFFSCECSAIKFSSLARSGARTVNANGQKSGKLRNANCFDDICVFGSVDTHAGEVERKTQSRRRLKFMHPTPKEFSIGLQERLRGADAATAFANFGTSGCSSGSDTAKPNQRRNGLNCRQGIGNSSSRTAQASKSEAGVRACAQYGRRLQVGSPK